MTNPTKIKDFPGHAVSEHLTANGSLPTEIIDEALRRQQAHFNRNTVIEECARVAEESRPEDVVRNIRKLKDVNHSTGLMPNPALPKVAE